MGLVVVLITMLVGLLSGLTAGLAKESTSGITGLPADHLVFEGSSEGASFTDSSLPKSTWNEWQHVDGVTSAEPLAIQRTNAGGANGAASTSVAVFGVGAHSSLAPAPKQLKPGQVVLSEDAAEELSAQPGAKLRLGGTTVTVAAVRGNASFSHSAVVWASLADYQQLTRGDAPVRASVLALRTTSEANLAAADQRLGTTTLTVESSLSAIGSFSAENTSLRLMRGFLFAISALVIGAFFTVWTIQRSGDIAVLKALGASTWYLLRDSLGQALVVLVGGTALGAGLAAAFGALAAGTVPFVLELGTTVIPALVMIALGAAGAALAIRRITAVDPLTALGSAR